MAGVCGTSYKEIAEADRALIIADLSIYDAVPDRAVKVGTNPFKLKKLTKTNYTLQAIGEPVGLFRRYQFPGGL